MSARALPELGEIRVGDVVRCTVTRERRKTIYEFPVDRIDGSYIENVTEECTNLSIYFFQENAAWELLERQMPPLPTEPNSVIEILAFSDSIEGDLHAALPVPAFRLDDDYAPWCVGAKYSDMWVGDEDITDWRPMKVVPA